MNMPIDFDQDYIASDMTEFFPPASTDMIDALVSEYRALRQRIVALGETVKDPCFSGALHHFIEGNCHENRTGAPSFVWKIFDVEGAIAHLDAHFWDKTLKMTDVLDLMPQERRSEWFDQIRECKTPPYEDQDVRATLATLIGMRSQFFAERVDGIFRALSRTHVTNQPEGFSKRMIINGMIDKFGYVEWRKAGVINDLRCIIARFMGREEPTHDATNPVIQVVRKQNGTWQSIDGGALRLRIYNGVGTAHLEVHPDMAWRLNAVLASIYPTAIPSQFRVRPKRQARVSPADLILRPLPFKVVQLLAGMKQAQERVNPESFGRDHYRLVPKTMILPGTYGISKQVLAETVNVLQSIGGVPVKVGHSDCWEFDYDPIPVIDSIVCTGCIPDKQSFQFYPTPANLAEKVIELAGIEDHHRCLEPSAGTGAIACLMPKARTTCVEISDLHCKILGAQGFAVEQADFLQWSDTHRRFDRVLMNPPFANGQWQAHLDHAASVLTSNGRLVAILPSSAQGNGPLPGFKHEWHGPFNNEFEGTGVSVVILVAERLTPP